MRIIRKSERKTYDRAREHREVQIIFGEAIPPYDWLVITHSKTCGDGAGVGIGFHTHPNATELILFLRSGWLQVGDTEYHFQAGDMAAVNPNEVHGTYYPGDHDCLCLLLGQGKPQKEALEEMPRRGWRPVSESTPFLDQLDFDERRSLSTPETSPAKGRSILTRIWHRIRRAAKRTGLATELTLVWLLIALVCGFIFVIPLFMLSKLVFRLLYWICPM